MVLLKLSEQTKAEFETYDDLLKSGYIEKGWLPDFLPKSSRNILETHNIDTNHVEASFEYTITDTQSVENGCGNKTVLENGTEYKCKHEDSYILIKLMNDGEGYLYSSPLKENQL